MEGVNPNLAPDLIEQCRSQGILLQARDDLLEVTAPSSVTVEPELIDTLRTRKQDILAILKAEAVAATEIMAVLREACADTIITPSEVFERLGSEAVSDWAAGAIESEALEAFARSLDGVAAIERGERPAHYTHEATCHHCGPVWLWTAGSFEGCPWCRNRLEGKPIPRPHAVRCADCQHFERTAHARLGHCIAGQPEPPAGLWDTTVRDCHYFLPRGSL